MNMAKEIDFHTDEYLYTSLILMLVSANGSSRKTKIKQQSVPGEMP
tara:strand:- start:66136 stop:66273 length:138 start_codon:yes stop_codon:yes gene_type:complete